MSTGQIEEILLAQALRLDRSARLALVGAGGKTTALFLIARQLKQQFASPVLLSASTHLAVEQLTRADTHFEISSAADFPEQIPPASSLCLFTGPAAQPNRVSGLDFALLEQLSSLAARQNLPLLIEADGSRRLPLKAPAAHEPAIPWFANLVAVVAGLSGLGRLLLPESVHRPDQFGKLSGLSLGAPVSPAALAGVLLSPEGGLKNIPPTARRAVILNQVDSPALQVEALRLAARLLPTYQAVLSACLAPPGGARPKVHWVREQVAGIILAAGEAARFGSPKQLLIWEGVPLVRRAAMAGLQAGLAPVLVVTGAHAAQVEAALAGLPVQLVHNPSWQQGQSASVQAGLRALPEHVPAALFLLVDQPALTAELIGAILERRFQTYAPLVVPRVGSQRANPVLFDRLTFPYLMGLEGDVGGRALLSGNGPFPLAWVDWPDPAVLLDIDDPEDYERFLNQLQSKGIRL